ncbi:ATP-dependent RNA helicase DBP10 [Polytolypa hystricis UAMH7299]|uniref:ATP-dependent RNA helicase DBP10 n=1 Tax=Polytolypa hystricis (strain UAMH7299) TaxID=1447883 RepID=A0A2B7XXY2_POLH7|nr:ATP-dependent RNA helicase DBP10 [Polytolypa hystricis UAMH7299]
MSRRAASPAASENEFDISKLLFKEDDRSDIERPSKKRKAPQPSLNLDVMGDDDDDADGDGAFIAAQQVSANRKASNLKGRTVKKGGGFQAMGLSANLLKAIARKGFSVPTPIQRKTIPLLLDDQDVVGMARTGSGKTAAFVIPMIEKLKSHSAKVGARGLILSPSRELALQTLKVVKELGRGTDLKSVLLVGGDSLEEQFGLMASNPDIMIATPGRFLHLKVEMQLDLSSVRYVVFDEADRLFEMGFAAQLAEILHALPTARQTLLFSATLPKSLVEFARAGLQEPKLVRLDAEGKISPDLQNAFFTVKSSEKEGALLHLLHEIIKVPTGETDTAQKLEEQAKNDSKNSKKRKRSEFGVGNPKESPTEHSTIIFAATKHHVDYITSVLRKAGFATSYAYGSLDQTARKIEVQNFRSGITHLLVVTDVAARGIDIPILANVINYDFPSQAKIFVHRVGRTARAGQKGWSYSLIRGSDAPYLLDLQLFLGRPLVMGRAHGEVSYADSVVLGSLPRDLLARHCEWTSKLLDEDADIDLQREVAAKGEKLYIRTRNSASAESAKRSKDIIGSDDWMVLHPLFNDEESSMEVEREKMLARIGGYRPQETIFEIGGRRGGKKIDDEAADRMRRIRSTLESKRQKIADRKVDAQQDAASDDEEEDDVEVLGADDDSNVGDLPRDDMSLASESELEVTFSYPSSDKSKAKDASKRGDLKGSFQNPEYFMAYTPASHSLVEDRGYGVHSGTNSNFVEASRTATMDLAGDEGARGFGEARSIMRWDKRHKKYVARQNDDDGSKGTRLVRGESGAKIAASFRSGRFDAWKKGKRIGRMPRVGEFESTTSGLSSGGPGAGGKRFRHKKELAPKAPDKLRGDYEKKVKKFEAAKQRAEEGGFDPTAQGKGKPDKGKSELKSVEDVWKARNMKEKRREKNARPARKGKGR